MKALLINGSPREIGNTARALKEVADTLNREGIETEIFWIGKQPVRGCVGCCACRTKQLGRCIFNDDIANRIVEKLPSAVLKANHTDMATLMIVRIIESDPNREERRCSENSVWSS